MAREEQRGKRELGFKLKEVKEFAQEAGWKVGLYEVRSFGKEAWVFEKVTGKGEEVLKVPTSQPCFSLSDTAGRRRC